MPKQITFTNKEEALEYARAMRGRGWDTLLQHDSTTNVWIVYVSLVKEGKVMPESKVPTTISGILASGETEAGAETAWSKRQFRRLGRGAKRAVGEVARSADEDIIATAKGKTIGPILRHTSRRIDVVGGMTSSIPVPGGGRHGYLARIGEMKAARIAEAGEKTAITGMPKPDIAKMPEPGIKSQMRRPGIASGSEVQLGVSREVRFKLPSGGLGVYNPYKKKVATEETKEQEESA